MISVVIPAHNEEQVIAQCLDALLAGPATKRLDIIVAANGCTDRTVPVARGSSDRVRVVEVPEASKTAALNAGLAAAHGRPVVFLDADVVLDAEAVVAVAEALAEPGVLAASTGIDLDVAGAGAVSRSYHRFWMRLPSIRDGLAGRGVYALSADGVERIGRFPAVVADDRWIHLQFGPDERRTVAGAASTVAAAPRVLDLLRRKSRVFAGNAALPDTGATGTGGWRAVVRSDPRSLVDLPAYLGINLAAKAWAWWSARRGEVGWRTDHGSRARAPVTAGGSPHRR